MRDFPMFTTENGVGSITLKEVPYKGIAYVKIHASLTPELFLQECVEFCKLAGATKIYASGSDMLTQYPLHTVILQLSAAKDSLPESDAALFPVTEQTAEQWRSFYNERMRTVDNSSTMTKEDMKELVLKGGGYFVHQNKELLGIGIARGEKVDSVISLKPGAGREVLLALCGSLTSQRIVLEVASTNTKAVKLYEKLGFIPVCEISRWYQVLTIKNT